MQYLLTKEIDNILAVQAAEMLKPQYNW